MKSTLRFHPSGRVGCLYTEAINLRVIGRLHVVRATDLRFNDQTQQWEACHADTGEVLFSDSSRTECLRWEHDNLQPQASTPPTNPTTPSNIMRQLFLLLVTLLLITACGRNESQLRSELQSIDAEMLSIRIAAQQHRARMDEAEFNTFIASFAAGYGTTSGDYDLAGEGVDAAVEASRQYDVSGYSLDQLRQRYETLAKRRAEILAQLG